MSITAIVASVLLLFVASYTGMLPMLKLIKIYEARHELKRGSAGWLRTISGWSIIVFWGMCVWFIATILGDWIVNQDLNAAFDRALWRLRILLEIAMAVMDSD